MANNAKLLHLLLVEDDDDHAYLVSRNLKAGRIANTIDRVADGAEALDYIYKRGKYSERVRPDIILLDLKLPKVDGLEVLETLKSDPKYQAIPIVILTTSASEADRSKAYTRHANSYVVKPLDSSGFNEMVTQLSLYWGMINVQPPAADK